RHRPPTGRGVTTDWKTSRSTTNTITAPASPSSARSTPTPSGYSELGAGTRVPALSSLHQPRLCRGAVAVGACVGDAHARRRGAALQRDALTDQRADDGGARVRGPAAPCLTAAGPTGPEHGAVQPGLLRRSLVEVRRVDGRVGAGRTTRRQPNRC